MKTFHKLTFVAIFLLGLMLMNGCDQAQKPAAPEETPTLAEEFANEPLLKEFADEPLLKETRRNVIVAFARLNPIGDSNVRGAVLYIQKRNRVHIIARVRGLTPGKHGFHIHTNGDCSAGGTGAGGHYNPDGSPHGAPDNDAANRHVGDMGNLNANSRGKALYRRVDTIIKLKGPQSVIDRGIIVHADEDDFGQPTGNAGARVACGIITQIH